MEEFLELDALLDKSPSTMVLAQRTLFDRTTTWVASDLGLRRFIDMLREKYEEADETGDSYLFARRPDGASLLGVDPAALFQIGVRDGALGDGLTFARCSLKAPWSVEVVVKPGPDQVPYTALIGNHPGMGLGGFILHHESPGSCAWWSATARHGGESWRLACGRGGGTTWPWWTTARR